MASKIQTQFWGEKYIEKKTIKKILKFDYLKILEQIPNKGWKLIYNDKKLLSVSSILKTINDCFLWNVPTNILEHRKYLGKSFMENANEIFKNKLYDLSILNISEMERKHLETFFNWLVQNKFKIVACEKLITNGCVVAFIDFVVRNEKGYYYVVEVKLRNSLEIRKTDIFQTKVYCEMLGIPGIVVVIGDNGEINTQRLSKITFKSNMNLVKKFYKTFGIELFYENKIEIGEKNE